MGYGFPVQCHCRWPQTQVPVCDRGAQPPLPSYPGGQALEGKRRGGGAGRAPQPLPGIGVHPVEQRAGVHCPGTTGLVRGPHHHQDGLHRARIPVGERFVESCNGRFRDEFLKNKMFTTDPEAQLLAERWG